MSEASIMYREHNTATILKTCLTFEKFTRASDLSKIMVSQSIRENEAHDVVDGRARFVLDTRLKLKGRLGQGSNMLQFHRLSRLLLLRESRDAQVLHDN